MIWKILMVIFVLIVLTTSFYLIYQYLPQDPIKMSINKIKNESSPVIDYGTTPIFMENLRFNHNNISYFIDSDCGGDKIEAMEEAFRIFHKEMEIIDFYKMNGIEADILVGCSNDYVEIGENLFAAGEGGPSRIINTTLFKTIQKGKISLYKNLKCDYPVVEIHELSHVFGFDHTPNMDSIMYNTSRCNQRITPDMVTMIKRLYSIEPLPDAKIIELVAVKRGRYLDFNITILNEGLIEIENISLTISSKDKIIEEIFLDKIGIGYGRTLRARNIALPSRNLEIIDFTIDKENKVRELDKENNFAQMIIKSQKS